MKRISLYRAVLIFCALFIFQKSAFGQGKTIVNETILWYYYSQKVKLNENWSLSGTAQYRDFIDRDEDYHIFLTAGATRKLKNGFSVGFGFTNLNINRRVGDEFVLVPEIRPFQSLSYGFKQGNTNFSWRIMAEERWFRNAADGELVSGHTYQWRFRNKFLFMFPIADKLSLELSSEVMVNAGDQIVINVFDQHRGIVQFHYDLAPFKIMAGYMHWFFQTGANQHQNRHTILMGFSHSLDLSK